MMIGEALYRVTLTERVTILQALEGGSISAVDRADIVCALRDLVENAITVASVLSEAVREVSATPQTTAPADRERRLRAITQWEGELNEDARNAILNVPDCVATERLLRRLEAAE